MAALLIALPALFPAHAATPGSAAYSNDPTRLFWILHISDTHIGSEWYQEDERFEWLLTEGLDVLHPTLVINTGDLCDGSLHGIPATGQSEDEWALYRDLIDQAGMTTDFYLDLPGNHDVYGDPGLTHYMAWSLNGSTFAKTTRAKLLTFPFGTYFIYGTATPGESGEQFIDPCDFSPAELTELELELTVNDAADLILVFGHHRLDQPDDWQQAENSIRQHQALYFHGHQHTYETYLQNGVVVSQVDALGKDTKNNVAIIAVDNNAVAYAVTDSEDPWPFIVITAPADRRLTSNEVSPYAYEVGIDCQENPVRALVFDVEPITEVTFQAEGGSPVQMTRDASEPRLWHGVWDTTGLTAGEITLGVSATGTGTRTRAVSVLLDEVTCPDPWQAPDAGVPDAGPLDAGPPDAAPARDASPQDARAQLPDGNLVPGPEPTGCGCQTRGPGSSLPLFLLLLCAPAWLRRRRRGG